MDQYYSQLKLLVENAKLISGKRIIFLAHSNGNLIISNFLKNKVSEEWRRQNIDSIITVGAPWLGTTKSALYIATGEAISAKIVDLVSTESVRNFSRHMPSVAQNLPLQNNLLFATVNGTSYYTEDMNEFLYLIPGTHAATVYKKYKDVERLPNVPFYCVYGARIPSPKHIVYDQIPFTKQPKIEMGDGDGTVLISSLSKCRESPNLISYKQIEFGEHTSIMESPDFQNYVKDIIISKTIFDLHEPQIQNLMLHKDEFICISNMPIRRCRLNQDATAIAYVSLEFVCFQNNSKMAKKVEKEHATVYLTDIKPHLKRNVEFHLRCINHVNDFSDSSSSEENL